MQKLIILQGLPASGKSTYAKKLVNDNPENTVIVNRDSIREGFGKYWVPSRENLVTRIENKMIDIALAENYNVIVDAVNLNPKTIAKLKQYERVNVEVIYKHFEIPLWKCVFRDWKRGLFGGRKVGYKIIKSFYDRYYKNTRS